MAGAASLIGNLVGSPLGGSIADILGRRACILTAWCVFVISSATQGFAQNVQQLCAARMFLGWSVGAHYTGTTAFLSETLRPKHVGFLLSFVEANFFLGNFFALLIGAGLRSTWRVAVSMCALPVVVAVVCFFYRAKETPSWIRTQRLRAHHTQTDAGSEADNDVVERVRPLQELNPSSCSLSSLGGSEHVSMTTCGSLTFASIFWGSLIVPTYAVSAFAVSILNDLNLNQLDPFQLNVFLGAAAALGVFVGMVLVDRWGRKPLLLLSQWGVAAAFVLLGVLKPWVGSTGFGVFIMIALLVSFELLNGAGAPLALVYPAEIFPPRIKGIGSGLAAMNSRIMAVVAMLVVSYSLTKVGSATTLGGLGITSAFGAIVTHFMAPTNPPPADDWDQVAV